MINRLFSTLTVLKRLTTFSRHELAEGSKVNVKSNLAY